MNRRMKMKRMIAVVAASLVAATIIEGAVGTDSRIQRCEAPNPTRAQTQRRVIG